MFLNCRTVSENIFLTGNQSCIHTSRKPHTERTDETVKRPRRRMVKIEPAHYAHKLDSTCANFNIAENLIAKNRRFRIFRRHAPKRCEKA